MITANPKAHMSPKDLARLLASEAKTVPGWGLNDKAFHASFTANQAAFSRFSLIREAIKAFYLNQGHTVQQWQAVSANLHQFNRVWRQSLGLMPDVTPPPLAFRRVQPKPSNTIFAPAKIFT